MSVWRSAWKPLAAVALAACLWLVATPSEAQTDRPSTKPTVVDPARRP